MKSWSVTIQMKAIKFYPYVILLVFEHFAKCHLVFSQSSNCYTPGSERVKLGSDAQRK